MSRLQRILETGAEPAPKRVQRRVGTVAAVLIAALTGWAVFKNVATGDLAETEIAAGLDDLASAVESQEPAGFDEAEEHFVDAASVSMLDRYPAFLISSTRKIAASEGETAHDEIARRVAAGDLVGAREQIEALRAESPTAARYWTDLLDALELRLDE